MNKKLFIVIFTSIITVGAIVWALTRTPIYEVKSNIQIGFIGKDLIANPDTLIKVANLVFNVEDKIDTKEEFISEVISISKIKKLKNFIEIKTEAISNDEALKKNKEVISYIKNKYIHKIDQSIINSNSNIRRVKVKISNLENLEAPNIKRQIELLKTQEIVKIDEKIKFYKKIKTKSINEKIKLHIDKLIEYTKEVKQIYQNNKETTNTTSLTIASLQMVNYQNLILNSQNKVEDLKIEIELINNEVIPNLKRKKKNIQDDKIRILEYKLKVELHNKKVVLLEQINQLKLKNTDKYIQNTKEIGRFIVQDYPIKPKKKLIVVVAFITGLILSIFLVFFLEFIQGAKRKDSFN